MSKTVPIVLGAIFYSLNSFVDNFMVTTIPNGVASLGYANAWTGITISFFIGIAIFGSVLVGQYYGSKRYDLIREVINFRVLACLIVALIFATAAWTNPHGFLSVFSHGKDQAENQTIQYLQVIAVTWILMAFTFNSGNYLRELGFAKTSFVSTFIILMTNIIFNSIFVFGLKMGVVGTAYASIISRGVGLILNPILAYMVNKKVIYYYCFFQISKPILKQYAKRLVGILLYAISVNLVVFRISLWNAGFPSLGASNYYLNGASVIAITTVLTNILSAGYASINGSINFFIGKKLGVGNIDLAMTNSRKLLGVSFLIGVGLSLFVFLIVVVFLQIPHFSNGVYENTLTHLHANNQNGAAAVVIAQEAVNYYNHQVILAMIVICGFNPLWIVMLTSLRITGSGGKSNLTSSVNFSSGLIQIAYLALIVFVILPKSPTLAASLPLSYLLFYLSDLIKGALWLVLQFKSNWAINLNDEYDKLNKKVS